MNMLTSLKALLFSSAATRMPADGAGVAATPGEGAADFASLLTGTMEAAGTDAPPAVTPALAAVAKDGAMEEDAVQAGPAPLSHGLATALNAIQTHRKPSLPLPPGIARKVEAAGLPASPDAEPASVVAGEAVDPVAAQPVAQTGEPLETPVAEADTEQPTLKPEHLPKPHHPAEQTRMAEAAPVSRPTAPQAEKAEAEQDSDKTGEDDKDEQRASATDAAPVPAPNILPLSVKVAAPLAQTTADVPVQSRKGRAEPDTRSPSIPPVVPQAAPVEQAAAATPSTDMQPNATPLPTERPVSTGKAPTRQAAQTATPSLAQNDATAGPESAVIPDQPAAPAAVTNPRLAQSEALALLQLVRDQVAARQSGARVRGGEQPSAANRRAERATPVTDATISPPLPPGASDAVPPSVLSQPSTVVAPSIAPQPVANLSASLGAQMVDMGVSGQWIDGLARDIAGLSANGAQGRFQINADQLGPVQVDIRQGTDGAAVSLTVASEAAEMALRQDSDRLRLDAGLSAVRIAEVKIERAPHVAEAARTDGTSQQSSQQQQPSQQQSSPTANGWANGQNMNQPQGQGRWRGQENNGFTPKNSADPAVLNHDDPRGARNDAARARYA